MTSFNSNIGNQRIAQNNCGNNNGFDYNQYPKVKTGFKNSFL